MVRKGKIEMNVNKRDICLFAGGALTGAVVGGAILIVKLVTSETFRPVISKVVTDKLVENIFEEYSIRPRPEYVSYMNKCPKRLIKNETCGD